MVEKFDAIVVGAGPSGNSAAYTLAKAGLSVLQIERGEYSGSKNVQGARACYSLKTVPIYLG
jgi:electron transfer flavoprotein-quinone oxidoreductase